MRTSRGLPALDLPSILQDSIYLAHLQAMYRCLDSVRLKSGEEMECGVVEAPDRAWAAQIEPLLSYQEDHYRRYIAAALAGPLDGLETRFYLGTIGGRAATCVCIMAARGAGILGHVFTVPEHRRKGAYSQLMARQMDDCRQLGLRIMTLGSIFKGHPYWIYHSFGFRSIDGTSGRMKWLAHPAAEQEWYRQGAISAGPLVWDDWPPLNVTAMRLPSAGEEAPRSWALRLKRYGSAEGAGLQVLQQWRLQRGVNHVAVLRSEHGAVVGWAMLKADDLAFGDGWLLDVYIHSDFQGRGRTLIEQIPWPARGRVAAYTTHPDGFRAALLSAAGFRPVAVLAGWMRADGEPQDLHVLAREA